MVKPGSDPYCGGDEAESGMLYLGFSIVCSVVAVLIGRRGLQKNASPFMIGAIAFLTAAVISVVFSAIAGQFPEFEILDALFGAVTGVVFALGGYFLLRGLEEKTFVVPISALRVAMLAPIILAVLFFDGLASLSTTGAIGLGVGCVGLALLAIGGKPTEVENRDSFARNAWFNTAFVVVIFAFGFIGIQAFSAVVMNPGENGLFLIFLFGVGGLVQLGLTLRRKNGFGGAPYGIGMGAFLFASYLLLLLALAVMPGWKAFGAAACGHVVLAGAAGLILTGDRFQAVGYLGLGAAALGTGLVFFG